MKTKEELNALKNEVEALNKKLAELTDEELKQVIGGIINGDDDIWILFPHYPEPPTKPYRLFCYKDDEHREKCDGPSCKYWDHCIFIDKEIYCDTELVPAK